MRIEWVAGEEDIRRVRNLVDSQSARAFVRHRTAKNLDGPVPEWGCDIFWEAMVCCLLSTQQRSGPDSALTRFICARPFALGLEACRRETRVEAFVEDTITRFGGLRRAKRTGGAVAVNLAWLERGGWRDIEGVGSVLRNCRRRKPQGSDKMAERAAAALVRERLKEFGPKQSRNLWQALGLTRFEIPIDSRITRWLNRAGFALRLSASALADPDYYDLVMDGIQELCCASGVYPCVLDAAIFASFDPEWPADRLIW